MYEVDSFDGGPRAQHRLSDETSATANGESGGLAVLLSREEKLKGKRVCKFKFKDATDRPVIKATLTAARNRCRRCKPDITLGVLNGVRLVPGARVIVQASERGVEAECDDNRRAHQLGVRQAQARDSEHLTRAHTHSRLFTPKECSRTPIRPPNSSCLEDHPAAGSHAPSHGHIMHIAGSLPHPPPPSRLP